MPRKILEITDTEIQMLQHEGRVELTDYIRNNDERTIIELKLVKNPIEIDV